MRRERARNHRLSGKKAGKSLLTALIVRLEKTSVNEFTGKTGTPPLPVFTSTLSCLTSFGCNWNQ
jgi:hypothetical protein